MSQPIYPRFKTIDGSSVDVKIAAAIAKKAAKCDRDFGEQSNLRACAR